MAQEHQIAVVEAGELAESLYQVEVGTYIPEPFYDVVAEILAFIWRQNSIEGGKGVSG
jgi:flagellar biosynthetic protein FlhB